LHKGIIDLRTAFRYEYDDLIGFWYPSNILRRRCFQERRQCEQGIHDVLDQLDTEARSIEYLSPRRVVCRQGQKCIKTIEDTKLQTYYGYM